MASYKFYFPLEKVQLKSIETFTQKSLEDIFAGKSNKKGFLIFISQKQKSWFSKVEFIKNEWIIEQWAEIQTLCLFLVSKHLDFVCYRLLRFCGIRVYSLWGVDTRILKIQLSQATFMNCLQHFFILFKNQKRGSHQ